MTDRFHLEGVRTLVTGASGFIGGQVARGLVQGGAEVVGTSRPGSSSGLPEGIHEIPADLTSADECRRVVEESQPAVVFNLVGYGIRRSETDGDLARKINAEAPVHLVDALASTPLPEWPGSRLVHVGSAAEYGEVSGDLSEDGPARPVSTYGKTKLQGTRGVRAQSGKTGVRAVTLRLFTVYGPGEPPGRLLPTLLAARNHSEPIDLTEGLQVRDFTHVGDVVEGLVRAAGLPLGAGEVLNLGTGHLSTVRDFVETAAAVLGLDKGRLRFGAVPTRSDEMAHDPVNIERCRAALGWVPSTPIAEGIRRTARDLA